MVWTDMEAFPMATRTAIRDRGGRRSYRLVARVGKVRWASSLDRRHVRSRYGLLAWFQPSDAVAQPPASWQPGSPAKTSSPRLSLSQHHESTGRHDGIVAPLLASAKR
jgi:hypothetical protein